MKEWARLERGQPIVEGVHPQASGLLEVRISLNAEPPDEWVEFFLHPVGVGISLSMHPPQISGDEVIITPPDPELEAYVRHVDERIEAANARYEADVLPRLRRARETDAAQQAADERRTAEARQRAKDL